MFYFVGKGEKLPLFNQYFWILPPKQSSSMGIVCKTFSENAKKTQKFITKHVYRCLLCFSQFNSYLNILKYQKICFFQLHWKRLPKKVQNVAFLNSLVCSLKNCQKRVGTLLTLYSLLWVEMRWVPGICGDLVVKNKLSPCSSFRALRQVNSIHEIGFKVSIVLKFFVLFVIIGLF